MTAESRELARQASTKTFGIKKQNQASTDLHEAHVSDREDSIAYHAWEFKPIEDLS